MIIGICDDEIEFLKEIEQIISNELERYKIENSIYSYSSSRDFLDFINSNIVDAVFLDIDMPNISGFDIAKAIVNINSNTKIIFVSSKNDMVYDSFEYSPFYFLCKKKHQQMKQDICNVVNKLRSIENQKNKIIVTSTIDFDITINDIMYIKSEKHYLLYYLANNPIPLKERNTISKKEKELLPFDFIKPHQRFLVNLNYISSFNEYLNTIILKDKTKIPISKSHKDKSLMQYKIFKRK